jgi:hypothetical protein
MFRAFVDESPARQAPGSVSTYGSTNNKSRTGVIALVAVVALVVLGVVVWLAVK